MRLHPASCPCHISISTHSCLFVWIQSGSFSRMYQSGTGWEAEFIQMLKNEETFNNGSNCRGFWGAGFKGTNKRCWSTQSSSNGSRHPSRVEDSKGDTLSYSLWDLWGVRRNMVTEGHGCCQRSGAEAGLGCHWAEPNWKAAVLVKVLQRKRIIYTFIISNWFIQLWRLRSPNVCRWRAGLRKADCVSSRVSAGEDWCPSSSSQAERCPLM